MRLEAFISLIFLASPVLLHAQSRDLIRDDFSSNMRNWSMDEQKAIRDGIMSISAGESGADQLISVFIDPQKDFSIEAEFKQVGGLTSGPFGLVWGSNEDNFNLFLVSCDQDYAVYSGDPSQLKKWKTSAAIRGLNEKNTMRVANAGGKLSFEINGQKIDEQKPFPFFGTWLGFLVLDQMQLEIDNLVIRQDQVIGLPSQVTNFSVKENLGASVNSIENDLGPIISSDGKTLYFARQNVKENVGGVYDDEDIWVSYLEKAGWSRSVNLGKSINTVQSDNLIAVSADNNAMIFEKDNALAARYRTATGWSAFEKMDLSFKNESDYFVATLSADGKAIIFSAMLKENAWYDSKRPEADLYVSVKDENGKWLAPVNLGRTINSAGDETSPFLSADGRTLYFATDGRPGYGYQDIFFSRRNGDSWTSWTEPLNLGPGVNSTGFDAYYTQPASGDFAYFVSYDNSIGKADIFRIRIHEEFKPNPVILVRGVVMNKNSKDGLGAIIRFENLATGKEVGEARSDPRTGVYQIVLPFGAHYGVRATLDGFYSVHENLELTQKSDYQEVVKDLLMVPIAIGETMKLNNVFFEAGLAVLKAESYPELDRLVTILRDNAGIHIALEGHTDAKGNPDALMKLSKDRVDAVKAYLVSHGIEAGRITGEGFGASRPVAPSDTEENSKLNRRVEFKITKK